MKTMWKGKHALAETGEGLLLMTVKQEYELIVTTKKIEIFKTVLSQLVDAKQVSRQVAFDWEMQFASIRTLISRFEGGPPELGATLETSWQDIPTESFDIILRELKNVFTTGLTLSISGTAPTYQVEYRFGTFRLVRAIDPTSFLKFDGVLAQLQATDSQTINSLLANVADGKLDAIGALNRMSGTQLAGTPLGGLSIAIAVGAIAINAPLAPNAELDEGATDKNVIVQAAAVAGVILTLAKAWKTAAEGYRAWQEGEIARAKADRLNYETQRDLQRKKESAAGRLSGGVNEPNTNYGRGGPSYEGGMRDAAGRC